MDTSAYPQTVIAENIGHTKDLAWIRIVHPDSETRRVILTLSRDVFPYGTADREKFSQLDVRLDGPVISRQEPYSGYTAELEVIGAHNGEG